MWTVPRWLVLAMVSAPAGVNRAARFGGAPR
jgi:hypothetical protein